MNKLYLILPLLIILLLPIISIHADESMGAIHVYVSNNCSTMKWAMASVRFDSNVTVKDNHNITGLYVIEYILSDKFNNETFRVSLRENNSTHIFSAILYNGTKIVSTQTMIPHGNSADNFTTLNRKFQPSDFINFNLVPLDHEVSFQWYAKFPPFNNNSIIIAEGGTLNIPKNFNATDETLLFIGANGHNATFSQLNAYVQLTQEALQSYPISTFQSYSKISPCGNLIPMGSSNACEQIIKVNPYTIEERMTA